MLNLFRNVVVSYASSFLGFLTIAFSANLLGADEFSWVALGVAAGAFGAPLINLGSDWVFVREATRVADQSDVERMVLDSLGTRLAVLGLLLIPTVVLGVFWNGALLDEIALLAIFWWASLQGLYPAPWYDFKNDTFQQNQLILCERVTVIVGLGVLALAPAGLHKAATLGCLLLFSRSISIVAQVALWWRRYAQSSFRIRLKWPKNGSSSISYVVAAAALSNGLLTYGNQLLIGRYPVKAEIAAYGLAFQVIGLIFLFQGQLTRLVSRKVAEASLVRERILRVVQQNALVLGAGSAVLAGACWVIISFLPMFLTDPRFSAMADFAPMLCIWIVIVGCGQSVTQMLLALGQDNYYLAIAMMGGIIAISIGWILVPVHGGRAAAAILLGVHSTMIGVNLFRLIYIAKLAR